MHQQNVEHRVNVRVTGFASDVFKFISQSTEKYDLIFAGPPYQLTNIDDLPKDIFARNLLNAGGWFILEHTPRNDYKNFPFYHSQKNYGTTIFSIFINDQAPDLPQ